MNKEILRLLNNLKCLGNEIDRAISFDILESEFEAFAENENIETISDLNDVIEDELSYWAENQ